MRAGILTPAPNLALALLAAPLVDQEVHRDQADLPEDEEQQQVQRQEDAQHAHLQQEEQDHVGLDPVLDAEGGQDRQRGQQRGQQHHGQRDAIHAQVEGGVDRRCTRRLAARTGSRLWPDRSANHRIRVRISGIKLSTKAVQRIRSFCSLGSSSKITAASSRSEQDERQQVIQQ